ncbi:MAG: T9SS C-terminal target domain-containing protein, partial [Saprospiraceae bacterium]|nr:T9SS C-terminal target domain-containing protein [Saprospiraceae bacterium]
KRVMRVLTLLLATVFSFSAFMPKAEAAPEKMVALILLMDDGDDKTVVTTLYTTLMAAEKVAGIMDIELIASDDPIADDVFVFALKSEEQKELTMKLLDEEGYELAGHNVMEVEEGNVYKALNVESLDDGTYLFQITDPAGDEINREITIQREK